MSFTHPPLDPQPSSFFDALDQAGPDGILIQSNEGSQSIEKYLTSRIVSKQSKSRIATIKKHEIVTINSKLSIVPTETIFRVNVIGTMLKSYFPDPLWKNCREIYYFSDSDQIIEALLLREHPPGTHRLILREHVMSCNPPTLQQSGWPEISYP